jgi:hypothetical protein
MQCGFACSGSISLGSNNCLRVSHSSRTWFSRTFIYSRSCRLSFPVEARISSVEVCLTSLAVMALRTRLNRARSSAVRHGSHTCSTQNCVPAETDLTFSALSYPADLRWCSIIRCRSRSSCYTVADEGLCQRAHLTEVDLIGVVHRRIFPFSSVLVLSVIGEQRQSLL